MRALLIVFIVLTVSLSSFAETWFEDFKNNRKEDLAQEPDTTLARQYLDSALLLIDRANFDQGIAFFQKVLDIRINILGKNHLDVALIYSHIGEVYYHKAEYDKALEFFHKTLIIRLDKLGEHHSDVATCQNNIGTVYFAKGENDKALESFQKALDIYLNTSEEKISDVATCYNNIGGTYYQKGEYDGALESFQKAQRILIDNLGEYHPEVAILYINMGGIYRIRGKLDKALTFFQKALGIWLADAVKGHPDLALSYNNIGEIYYQKGEYDKAIGYLQKALQIVNEIFGYEHLYAANICDNLGGAFRRTGDNSKALDFHQRALNIRLKKLGENHPDVALCYNNIGAVYYYIKDFDRAVLHNQIALDIRIKVLGKEHPVVAISYQNLGKYYQNNGEYDKALASYQKALYIRLKTFGAHHPEVAASFNDIGITYKNKGEYDKALEHFQKALDIRLETLGIESPEVIETFHNLGALFNQTKETKNAIENFENALNSLDLLRRSFTSQESKQFQLSKNYVIFERAIHSRLQAARIDQDRSGLKSAFTYSEKSKSNWLLESLNKTRAESFAGIPDGLLEKERDFRADLSFYSKKRFEELDKGPSKSDSVVNQLNSKIFDLKQEYNLLIDQFERDYPDYYQLKYRTNVVSVEQVQKELLEPEQTLLEYFVGDSSIFVFIIDKDSYEVKEIKKDFPLEEWVNDFRKSMTCMIPDEEPICTLESSAKAYARTAYQLYKKLILPVEGFLYKKLIVIPDGVLGYIPFEALLKEKPEIARAFKTHHYFTIDHQINYAYSATMHKEMKAKNNKRASNGWIGFAPEYTGDSALLATQYFENNPLRKGLRPLQWIIPEVELIRELTKGEIIVGADATENRFKEIAHRYRILHLAMHGMANDKVGDYSFLAFTELKDSIENERLYVSDLYNIQLNADMVVLSACETGFGELQRGEGIISLARGFSFAGARSIITTLWSIDDEQTKKLMEFFYKNLLKGMDKDEALRKAKLSYINLVEQDQAHPLYWAGFFSIGNMDPITVSSKRHLYVLALIALLSLIIFTRRKNKQT